jgi:hypothetical protein
LHEVGLRHRRPLKGPILTDRHRLARQIGHVIEVIGDFTLNNTLCLRNKSWKPECVGSFNMDWRILVFYPDPEARDKIY